MGTLLADSVHPRGRIAWAAAALTAAIAAFILMTPRHGRHHHTYAALQTIGHCVGSAPVVTVGNVPAYYR
jgi:hypothetical protein